MVSRLQNQYYVDIVKMTKSNSLNRDREKLEIGNILPGGLKPTKVITDENDPLFKMYKSDGETLLAVLFTEKGIYKLTKNN